MIKTDNLVDKPIVMLIDTLLQKAITVNASDIHIEPFIDGLYIRFRLDGILHIQQIIEFSVMHQIIARIKILAHIDTAEKRLPQDGKFSLIHGTQEIDFRVSTFPSVYGEKIVIRILNKSIKAVTLDTVGMNTENLSHFKQTIHRSSGFFLIAGPTGSGKTTTLYAALADINAPDKHIITLENPVEYTIKGITQAQINPDIGFTFEYGMRALLRQDPDVVMVGEIRDKQTARIALEAALTGHLVFSTIHTVDACSVVMRLLDMGIEPFLLNVALTGVISQRLVRKICSACKVPLVPSAQEKNIFEKMQISVAQLYKGSGCPDCNGLGYKGRIGIFEVLFVTDTIRALIAERPSLELLSTHARSSGMKPLLLDGLSKVQEGIITLQELMRVL